MQVFSSLKQQKILGVIKIVFPTVKNTWRYFESPGYVGVFGAMTLGYLSVTQGHIYFGIFIAFLGIFFGFLASYIVDVASIIHEMVGLEAGEPSEIKDDSIPATADLDIGVVTGIMVFLKEKKKR